jgi:hypothetical protein
MTTVIHQDRWIKQFLIYRYRKLCNIFKESKLLQDSRDRMGLKVDGFASIFGKFFVFFIACQFKS